jgi:hypothetical protein
MDALRTTRRASGTALIIGWASTVVVGIATIRAETGRGAAKGVAIEVFVVGVSLAATVVYFGARLGRAHIDDIKWALNAWRSGPAAGDPEAPAGPNSTGS